MNLERPLICTERLLLCMATLLDVPEIVRYYHENQAHFAPYRPIMPADFLTEEYQRQQISLYAAEFEQDKSARFYIFLREQPEQIIGNISFTVIQRGATQSCNVGYNLAENAQGHGYITEALRAAITYAFEQLHLHRLMAQYMPRNRRSGNVLTRLGFGVEGYARDYLLIAGEWQDHILTSLTNPNWQIPPDLSSLIRY